MTDSSRHLNPELDSKFPKSTLSTNDVIQQVEENGDVTYFLPCYTRFLVKEIENVSAEGMEASLIGTLLFSFYYGQLARETIEEFVGEGGGKRIFLEFNKEESIELKEEKGITLKEDAKQRIIHFVVRKSFRTNLIGNVFLTPFETLDMYISIAAQTVHLPQREKGGRQVNVKFNCMNTTEVDVLSHGEELSFGYYRIASYFLQAKYSCSRKNPFKPISYLDCSSPNQEKDIRRSYYSEEEKDEKHVQCYQYAHFRIPVYKYPGVSLLTIFIPIWILGLIGLFVFFQQAAFGARLATIAVLALAFVAFLPTINESIPQSPDIKLVDLLIIVQLASITLLLVESFIVRNEVEYEFKWEESNLFLISLALNALTFGIIFMLFVIHKCFWERKYTKELIKVNKKYKTFVRKIWRNRECDNEFSSFAVNHKLKNL